MNTFLEVDDKIIKNWSGLSLDQLAAEPHTFQHMDQKFVLKWVIADEDSNSEDTFTLEVNGAALDTLEYLVPNFKLVDEEPVFFDGGVSLNYADVYEGNFEWRAATLRHKIAEKVEDETHNRVQLFRTKHSAAVTKEVISVLSKLIKTPETGLEMVVLTFFKLDEKVSETVVDQFTRHTTQLKTFTVDAIGDAPEADKQNMADLAARVI